MAERAALGVLPVRRTRALVASVAKASASAVAEVHRPNALRHRNRQRGGDRHPRHRDDEDRRERVRADCHDPGSPLIATS